ncbi:hypothetical protein WA158_003267 [Blastocystis sp. Blastoise]
MIADDTNINSNTINSDSISIDSEKSVYEIIDNNLYNEINENTSNNIYLADQNYYCNNNNITFNHDQFEVESQNAINCNNFMTFINSESQQIELSDCNSQNNSLINPFEQNIGNLTFHMEDIDINENITIETRINETENNIINNENEENIADNSEQFQTVNNTIRGSDKSV